MDMPSVDVIVKFGGACLTKKKEHRTVNQATFYHTLSALQGVEKVIVVHGAGSFGHFEAMKYGLRNGIKDEKSVEGFCKTRSSVLSLHSMVLQNLMETGVNAFGVSPSASWIMDQGAVVQSDMTLLEDLLRQRFVPVLHGDCVRDRSKGFDILSGDLIVEALADHFKPKRVVFISDVDGVFDKPPTSPDATLLKEISFDLSGHQTRGQVECSSVQCDVTGGMASKLAQASSIARMNIPVFVVGPSAEEIVLAMKEGRTNGKGTKITCSN